MRILLTGQMRSGTTFLSILLNSQPGILLFPDFLHVLRLKESANIQSLIEPIMETQKQTVLDRFVGERDGLAAITKATGYEFSFHLAISEFNSVLDLYNAVFDQLGPASDQIRGHKSTHAELVVKELLSLCPDLVCVYLVRDPRDVVASNTRMMHQKPKTIVKNWKEGVTEILKLQKIKAFEDRLHLIRYEDLMSDPHATLTDLANFLHIAEIRIPEEMYWYDQPYVANSSFADIGQFFDTSGIGRWKSVQGVNFALIERQVREELDRLGYEHRPRGVFHNAMQYAKNAFLGSFHVSKK